MFDLLELRQLLPEGSSREYRARLSSLNAYLHRLRDTGAVPAATLDRLDQAYQDLSQLECDEQFAEGLRLGAELMVSLLTLPPRTPRP